MRIDVQESTHETFPRCRSGQFPFLLQWLTLLDETLSKLEQADSMFVEVADDWRERLDEAIFHDVFALDHDMPTRFELNPQNMVFYELLTTGTHELIRLAQAESRLAVRSTGSGVEPAAPPWPSAPALREPTGVI